MSLLTTFIAKSISLFHLGNAWTSSLCADICEAARTISYVETVGSKADTLHNYVLRSDERCVKRGYELCVREFLKKLHLGKVELAIDGKQDLYYGENGGMNIRQIKHENGADGAWEFVVISVVHPIHAPLMAIPYHQGDNLDAICIELIEFAKSLPLSISLILFDRGFYHSHLIDYLESKKGKKPVPYLIFGPKNEAMKNYLAQVSGKFGIFEHVMRYRKEKSSWEVKTTIAVCKEVGKDKNGEPYDWIFATNLKPSYGLVAIYRRRWNIETGFRIMEEGRIKTKSNSPLIRLFYFLLRALLVLIWTMHNSNRRYFTFKAYVRLVEKYLRKEEVYKPPPILPLF